MEVGQEFIPLTKEEITHTQLVRYAGASGDFNPIHTVVPFAEKAGLGGVIAHGMLIMGFVGKAIGTWFDVNRLQKFSVRFNSITRPGEKIIVIGSIIGDTNETWLCQTKALNEKGEVKITGSFEVRKN
ncbi:MaoC/PaaZ C-terminal domain-containing protein [Neobacillus niacini]|uniref:MaoC/PaaZ C-terminal domain-containing protein n=1 Tax=Neobacillus niacini TaxID=86668 RepID=UPI0021CB52C7|nr:MaoC/PaaZ C-terminal domain-containing protein [Neobacillus niacini]MCM3766194.1 3-hydroxyacyl-ACP dehydratase [Neobacillus niacini]